MFKPMLATDHEPEKLRFPYLASPKLDGIRAVGIDGRAMTRSLKEVPNRAIQEAFGNYADLAWLDGELIVGEATGDGVMYRTSSGVMSRSGIPDWKFHVFDCAGRGAFESPFSERLEIARVAVVHLISVGAPVEFVKHTLIGNLEDLEAYETNAVAQGYEGIMLRDPAGRYKLGRGTVKENLLLKVKRFVDAEGEIIGFEERMHNENEAQTNELGRTKRSTHQANMVPTGMLGAFIVRVLNGPFAGATVNVPGFTFAKALDYFVHASDHMGKIITFKYFLYGSKDAPRFPCFKSFRVPEDMS